jgi:uncharacterized membrane protein
MLFKEANRFLGYLAYFMLAVSFAVSLAAGNGFLFFILFMIILVTTFIVGGGMS